MDVINSCPGNLPGPTNALFMNFVNTFMATQCVLNQTDKYPEDMGPLLRDDDSFDFIVVGGGTAGSVVASRLAENSAHQVLLLEAGGIPSAATKVPGFRILMTGMYEDYAFDAEPTPWACLGTNKKTCGLTRGKALGGTATINGMAYQRGHPNDFDDWERQGNPGWKWDSVLPHFKKAEGMLDPNYAGSYGTDGPLPLINGQFKGTMRDAILAGAKELGYNLNQQEPLVGFFDGFMNIQKGERVSTSEAYISRKLPINNLHIAYNATVTKVLINNAKSAYGVQVVIGDKTLKLKASKEVVLSAGAISSPHILLNSGVGPSKHLASKKVKVIKDLPVGLNLQDHYAAPALYVVLKPTVAPPPGENSVYDFFWNRRGPLSHNNAYSFTGYLKTSKTNLPYDLQLYHFFHTQNSPVFAKYMVNSDYVKEITDSLLAITKAFYTINITPTVVKPKSKGRVELATNNPLDRPKIFTNHLSHPDDLQVLLDGTNFVLNLTKTNGLSPYVHSILNVPIPNCLNTTFNTDQYWNCANRNMGYSMGNLAGTCRMGPKSSANSVVGPDLKVHGINNLRVIDASIMPSVTSGGTLGPIVMIAEKGADLIKAKYA